MNWNLLSGFSIGALVGTALTTLISHFLEKNRLKSERKDQLQKEIYFETERSLKKTIENIDYINSYISSVLNKDLDANWKNFQVAIDTIGAIEVNIRIYAIELEEEYKIYLDTLLFIKKFRDCSLAYKVLEEGLKVEKPFSYQLEDILSKEYFQKKDNLVKSLLNTLKEKQGELLK